MPASDQWRATAGGPPAVAVARPLAPRRARPLRLGARRGTSARTITGTSRARMPVCPCARVPVCPCARVPVCPCAFYTTLHARVPVCVLHHAACPCARTTAIALTAANTTPRPKRGKFPKGGAAHAATKNSDTRQRHACQWVRGCGGAGVRWCGGAVVASTRAAALAHRNGTA